jgi:LytS/YehU family sensor histidine kinase
VVAIILAAQVVRSSTLTWGEAFLLTVPMSLLSAFICLTSFYLCRAFPLRNTGYPRLFGIYIGAATLSSGLWIMATRGWAFALSKGALLSPLTGENEDVVHLFFLNGILLYVLSVFLHYLMIAIDESLARERQALQQSVLAREAELRALRAQVHPHFLFNSLNSISALTTSSPNGAREMSIRLANFLRRTLKFGASDRATVKEEMALVEDYLTIEKTRFGERLRFEKDVDPAILSALVPPLILQPLIENAVNHGVAPLPEGGTIRLRGSLDGGSLRIVVDNPVDPEYISPGKGGLGLDNVRRRLDAIHGNAGRLTTGLVSGRFVAEIVAPFERDGGVAA